MTQTKNKISMVMTREQIDSLLSILLHAHDMYDSQGKNRDREACESLRAYIKDAAPR